MKVMDEGQGWMRVREMIFGLDESKRDDFWFRLVFRLDKSLNIII